MNYEELLGDREFNSPEEICEWMDSAATAITDLLARAEAAEAANTQLDGTVSTLMESNKRLVEELKEKSETELAKAHEALSAEWARQKMRANAAEEKYDTLLKAKFGENASAKIMEMADTVNEMRTKLAEAEARAEKAERERDAEKPREVLEAIDELVEFARERMSTADWLYYANTIGPWRGQKEE